MLVLLLQALFYRNIKQGFFTDTGLTLGSTALILN
jgi:hypothetical protein